MDSGSGGFWESPIFAALSAAGSFCLGLLGALHAWRRGSHDKEAKFREDILQANTELRTEVEKLKQRISAVEGDLHEALKASRGWELKFARARIILMTRHNIDLDILLEEDEGEDESK